jgi:hypothetical protein
MLIGALLVGEMTGKDQRSLLRRIFRVMKHFCSEKKAHIMHYCCSLRQSAPPIHPLFSTNHTMMKLFTLLVAAVLMLGNSASAFTVRPAATQVRSVANIAVSHPSNNSNNDNKSLTCRPMFVDWGVPEIAANPLGSIFMLVAIVSLWEVSTPGRAKKE